MDDDFERRRELRRQKREEMRLEAERLMYQRNEDDEEEAARERRRRARQESLRSKEFQEPVTVVTEGKALESNSMTDRDTTSGMGDPAVPSDEDQALLERLAKREERRQRRMMEAMERQRELDPPVEWEGHHPTAPGGEEKEEEPGGVEEEAEAPRRSYLVEQVREEKLRRSFSQDEETPEEKPKWSLRKEEAKQPNGGLNDDFMARQRKAERTQSCGSTQPEENEHEDEAACREAERKLEELKRRRGESESEELQRMRQRQQEAEAELEELKKRREERRKVLEEEERLRRQELEEKKAKEEEERQRMKKDIERRRAEAAEKRHRVEEPADGESRKPFQCLGPRISSLKIGERTEFLSKSAQKSSVKTSHTPIVAKIDNRLEQYTTAVQTNKEVRAPKSAAIDLPVVTDGVRNIKSMWETGNVFGTAGTPGSTNKETAGMKIGVAGRINDWLNKVPESGKTGGGKPIDLRPGDVTGKRNLWENKGSAPDKYLKTSLSEKGLIMTWSEHCVVTEVHSKLTAAQIL